MKQVLYIHWGTLSKDLDTLFELMQTWEVNPFELKQRWINTFAEKLPDFQIIIPEMPNKLFASYKIWKLRFEKHFPYLDPEHLILIWHSLGGMFLLKYLSENQFPFSIAQLHLVAPVLDDVGLPEWDNYLGDFAYDLAEVKNLIPQAQKIFLWHSKDDPVVPFHHSERIAGQLSTATFKIFEDRGHFSLAEFPELVETILTL